jgi:hypothetical protein
MRLTEVTAFDYETIREKLLKGSVHIKHDNCTLEYQTLLCKEFGGGLYQIGDACAVVERQQDGAIWVKELLTPDDPLYSGRGSSSAYNDAMAAIMDKFASHEYVLRTPSLNQTGCRFGMLAAPEKLMDAINKTGIAPWFGMAFD